MNETNREFWKQEYEENPAHTWVPDRILEREVEDLEPGTALDLGCGAGLNALMLAERGWKVTGVDWADNAIEMARKAAAGRGLDATFIAADTTLWKPPHAFDLVVTTYALPGRDGSRKVVEQARAALAPGGTLIVAELDKSMTKAWGLDEDELPAPGQIVAWLPGLEIEAAEVRPVDAFDEDDPRSTEGVQPQVAFVRARRV